MPRHFLSRSWTEKDYVYALRHDQFSHTLYERLSPVPKARLHASVAEVLEAAVAAVADPASVLELAVHFSEGISARTTDPGYRERAFRLCVEAGNLAARTVSYAKAAELLERAQRLAMRGGEPYPPESPRGDNRPGPRAGHARGRRPQTQRAAASGTSRQDDAGAVLASGGSLPQ
jgi:hypothetical protein